MNQKKKLANQPVFKWSGEYAGFFSGIYLFDVEGNYLGWTDNVGNVWTEGGEYMGKLIENNYILRSDLELTPASVVPVAEPAPVLPLAACMDRAARADLAGWVDAVNWL